MDSSEKMAGLGLLPAKSQAAADSCAEIPSGRGEVSDVDATVAVENVAKTIAAGEKASVDFGVLRLTGRMELAGIVNDPGKGRRGKTGATDNEKSTRLAFVLIGIHHPGSGVGVGIERKIRSAAGRTYYSRNAILEMRPRFVKTRAAAGVLPSGFKDELASGGIPGDRGAASSDDVG